MLKLNDSKTEFIIFGTSASLEKVQSKSIKIGNITISPVNSVRNTGAMFDSEMKMEVLSCHRFPCVPSFRAPIALCNFGALKNKE